MVDGTHEFEQHDPPATEQVHFCRTYIRPPMPRDPHDLLSEYEASRWSSRASVRLLVLVYLTIAWVGVAEMAGGQKSTKILGGVVVVALAVLYWVVRKLRFAQRLERDDVEDTPPVGSRLTCVGAPSQLPELDRLYSLPFEPRVYRMLFGVSAGSAPSLALYLLVLLGVLSEKATRLSCIFVSLMLLVVPVLLYVVRPVYFRVSPGRLEVLQYGYFSRVPHVVERYDLRRAYIVADFRMNRITVSESDKKGKNYSLLWMPQRREFLTTLFMAAVSEYDAPELPLDTL